MMKTNKSRAAFTAAVKDLLGSPNVQAMKQVPQHVDVNCFDHCVYVAYVSFLISRLFGLDSVAAARGGLLHDLFLYDWKTDPHKGMHLFSHPKTALHNAMQTCELSDREKDIILKHMWPVTPLKVPRYRESFVVNGADKLCALCEMLHIYHWLDMREKLKPAA